MTHLYKTAAAAIASLALLAGASAASAQSYRFNVPGGGLSNGTPVTAEGTLIQNVFAPGIDETTCHVILSGTVTGGGNSLTFTEYEGERISGGDLACDDSLDFPIVVTAPNATTISLDQFVVGTREGPCQENGFQMRYEGVNDNEAFFDARTFGIGDLCYADGSLAVTTDSNAPVIIVAN